MLYIFKFFTTPYGEWPYHLIPLKKWLRGYKKKYKELIIDSGVNDLINNKDYSLLKYYPLKNLPENVFWVIPDYPFGLGPNLTQEECIKKTRENIIKFHKCSNSICTVQYKFEDFDSFVSNYRWTYRFGSIIGIGNICKSRKFNFVRKIIDFIIFNNPKNKRIHFFGLLKYGIKYINKFILDFEISVDSMKWDYGLHCNRVYGNYNNTSKVRWNNFLKYYKDVVTVSKKEEKQMF